MTRVHVQSPFLLKNASQVQKRTEAAKSSSFSPHQVYSDCACPASFGPRAIRTAPKHEEHSLSKRPKLQIGMQSYTNLSKLSNTSCAVSRTSLPGSRAFHCRPFHQRCYDIAQSGSTGRGAASLWPFARGWPTRGRSDQAVTASQFAA